MLDGLGSAGMGRGMADSLAGVVDSPVAVQLLRSADHRIRDRIGFEVAEGVGIRRLDRCIGRMCGLGRGRSIVSRAGSC